MKTNQVSPIVIDPLVHFDSFTTDLENDNGDYLEGLEIFYSYEDGSATLEGIKHNGIEVEPSDIYLDSEAVDSLIDSEVQQRLS